MNRGDVVLVFYPFASGAGGKRRPGLVVQNDADNSRMAATSRGPDHDQPRTSRGAVAFLY